MPPEGNLGREMRYRLIAVAAWACLAFIVFATLSPLDLRPTLTMREPKIIVIFEHLAAFALLGVLFFISYPERAAFVCVVVFGAAILLELAQIVIPDRDARILDAIEKLAGGGFGIGLGRWMFTKLPINIKKGRQQA